MLSIINLIKCANKRFFNFQLKKKVISIKIERLNTNKAIFTPIQTINLKTLHLT